ncbi:MAG: DUF4340 domain-containing protein [Lentimicrobiaceae bacterium]|nr:DUF4340 domain-containing protein [Lentimicrobiaceae bacterium]
MKKQKVYFIIACLLVVLSVLAIVYKKGGLQKSANTQKISTAFAIKDTATITRIFMADMYGNKVLLTKHGGSWMVDNRKPAASFRVHDLLITLTALRIKQPIAKVAQRSIIEALAVNSTKVQVYETKPLFTIFRRPFFTKERLLKTYFLGDATQNNLGSYALLEGMSEPYIIYRPGFRGYVAPQFSPDPIDWYSPKIFSTKLTRIQNASFIDLENPENSFFVEKSGPRSFTLFDVHKNVILNYDTTLVINMLSEFRERNYEMFLNKISQSLKDSIIQFNFFKIISLTDVENQTTVMKLYRQIDEGELYEDGQLIEEIYQEFNRDRCYATINENTDELFTIQFFHFDRQIQPLSYFLKR